ncbi:uncharacterized protein LOC143365383 [Halictus rubicundus]|uniref:uncharacterized protein LOC143365383 n=1 Tax=Halictus rubicundus TaxID=77578 RepID=UPI004036F365
MSRSICTVFVALAIIQAAFACVEKLDEIIKLEEMKETIPEIELYEPEGTTHVGDIILGRRRENEAVYVLDYDYKNDRDYNFYIELHMPLPKDKKIHYLSGRNKDGSSIAMCGTLADNLDKSEGVVVLRFPPHSQCNVKFTFGAH